MVKHILKMALYASYVIQTSFWNFKPPEMYTMKMLYIFQKSPIIGHVHSELLHLSYIGSLLAMFIWGNIKTLCLPDSWKPFSAHDRGEQQFQLPLCLLFLVLKLPAKPTLGSVTKITLLTWLHVIFTMKWVVANWGCRNSMGGGWTFSSYSAVTSKTKA